MTSAVAAGREAILAALGGLEAAFEAVADLSFETLTTPEVVTVLSRLEVLTRRRPVVEHRLLTQLVERGSPVELGAKSFPSVLSQALRIGGGEANRRLAEAKDLGPRRTLTGQVLPPRLAATAAAQAAGHLGAEHVAIIRGFLAELPAAVDYQTRELAEADLARHGAELAPPALRTVANLLATLVNPDGDFSDEDRARKRGVSIGRQGGDGMSPISGRLDPQARATLEAVFAKLAAPGMCNPDDQSPCVDGPPGKDAVTADTRTTAQRQHDALTAMGRATLASGQLGSHHGLPVTVIVSTTLAELESGAGWARTGGGSLLPMTDLIRMASHAHHYLTIFDGKGKTLDLYRSRRIASQYQRIVLHAKDRGCSRPGCTVPGYLSEVHHAVADWADEGLTNIDDLTFACGPDNRLVKPGGWRTRKRRDGRTEWIPPPHLDTGQARVNNYHHPENFLVPDDAADDAEPD